MEQLWPVFNQTRSKGMQAICIVTDNATFFKLNVFTCCNYQPSFNGHLFMLLHETSLL